MTKPSRERKAVYMKFRYLVRSERRERFPGWASVLPSVLYRNQPRRADPISGPLVNGLSIRRSHGAR